MKRKLNKQSQLIRIAPALSLALIILALVLVGGVSAGQPEYEPAYINGKTVTINAIEVSQNAPHQAQADLYLVVYPIDWEALGVAPPQCNPCDHEGDGIDFFDFHDHVLDSIPSDPGHGEFRTLWHVFGVAPAYSFFTGGDPANDNAIGAAYASHLPATTRVRLPYGTPNLNLESNSHASGRSHLLQMLRHELGHLKHVHC